MHNKLIVILLIVCIFFPLNSRGKKMQHGYDKTIVVRTQKNFENLNKELLTELSLGHKKIHVIIGEGVYFFKERHLDLTNLNYPDAYIEIEGNNTYIIPVGRDYVDSSKVDTQVSGESSFINMSTLTPVDPWDDIMYADSLVEVLDTITNSCRLKCLALASLKLKKGTPAYIDLTRWCRCIQYKVERVENGYIYFVAHDLEIENRLPRKMFNVNGDYLFANLFPRFRLCFTSVSKSKLDIDNQQYRFNSELSNVHLCEASNFLTIGHTFLKKMSIKGITFIGGKKEKGALVDLLMTGDMLTEINDCHFIGQRNVVINGIQSSNVYIHHNIVKNNYRNGIYFDNLSANIRVENNFFENNGEDLSSNRCVTCCGENYYIAHNTFKNFGYCAICVGQVWHFKKRNKTSGIVEYNEMYYDQKYFEESWKHSIMDSGAVYVWTQNDDAVIRYNYIHDYTGMAQNNGIFCDDGASNFNIYGNIILNTPNYYSINSRRVAGTEKANNTKSFVERNNVNNIIMNNVTDCPILFVGREEENNGCIKGMNVILNDKKNKTNESKRKTIYKNLEKEENDLVLEFKGMDKGKVALDRNGWNVLKKELPCFNNIKMFLKRVD